MAFELPPLPYDTNALAAAGMCQETLELHHGKHHQAYVTALNGFVEKDAALQGKSLDDIVKATSGAGGPVFNNAGQHWNHIIFWECMSPNGGKIPRNSEDAPITLPAPTVAPSSTTQLAPIHTSSPMWIGASFPG